MKIFSERLKELRTERNMSFEKLSKETKLPRASLCRWENNQSEIKAPELAVLATYFGVTADYLIGLED